MCRDENPRLFHVDAFTDRKFAGNPAAVCLLTEERGSDWMQSVASEMNLSETAFVLRRANGLQLRWFTPSTEVDLCGHATLATAHVLWAEKVVDDQSIKFATRSGELTCVKAEGMIELDFPATPASETQPPEELLRSLNVQPLFVGQSEFDTLVVVKSPQIVRSLQPDFSVLKQIATRGVMVTSASDDSRYDFESRFFAPGFGIDEDPVTGSAHCCLAPYWSDRFGKLEMVGFQASKRGGEVRVRIKGDRVILGGHAVTVSRGELCG